MQTNIKMNTSDFWDLNYYNHPPLTEYMIDTAEKLLKVKLPTLFVELLSVQNGGFTKGFIFPLHGKAAWRDSYVHLHELFGIVTNDCVWTALNILDSQRMCQEWGLPDKQILLSVAEQSRYITLDYRSGTDPSVRCIKQGGHEQAYLARSFEDFFYGLIAIEKLTDV